MRAIFDSLGGGDIRIQAVLIAFGFGGLLEALAGFGAPVASRPPWCSAWVCPAAGGPAVLLANTAPVPSAPWAPPSPPRARTGIPATHIGAIVATRPRSVAVFVPFLLV
ncbi:L-lactate permease, partial [Rhodococcus hoagii]|nr:L-lactate permease [Prescottella equi]